MEGLTEAILKLWNEGMRPDTIAAKLGCGIEKVENEIEDPGNYPSAQQAALNRLADFG